MKLTRIKCICCGNKLKRLYPEPKEEPWHGMWGGGVVEQIAAGYGSSLDGEMYVIGICDGCLKQKAAEKTIIYTGNHLFPDEKPPKDINS